MSNAIRAIATDRVADVPMTLLAKKGLPPDNPRQPVADAPTLDEPGLKDCEVVVWHGVYAPKGAPCDRLDRVNAALRASLKDPDVAAKFAQLGAQIVPESKQTPAGLRDWLKSEIDKWLSVIRKAGAYAD
jgi:tripartite-type tricarboxylate transporter receptor subunit TctC